MAEETIPKRYGMTLRNANAGLLLTYDGLLLFKSEYSSPAQSMAEPGDRPEIYNMAGERYCARLDVPCIEVTEFCTLAARDEWEIKS